MAIATMTTNGRVTLPKEVRDTLNLKPGDRVDFTMQPNGTVRIAISSKSPRRRRLSPSKR